MCSLLKGIFLEQVANCILSSFLPVSFDAIYEQITEQRLIYNGRPLEPNSIRRKLQSILYHQYPPTYFFPNCSECKMVTCSCTKRKFKKKEKKINIDSEEEENDDDDGNEEDEEEEDESVEDSVNESVATRVVRLKHKQESKFIPYFSRPNSEGMYRLALFQRDPEFPAFWLCCKTTEEARTELVWFLTLSRVLAL